MASSYYKFELDDGTLECEFEVEGPEKGSWEGGQQISPDYPAEFYLLSVKCANVELIEILDEDFREKILNEIQENYPEDEPDYEPEYERDYD